MIEQTKLGDEYNGKYGSEYNPLPDRQRYPLVDDIDSLNKTGTFYGYEYNIGQAHAIDDFDENSVWFYITMVRPIEPDDHIDNIYSTSD